MKTCFIVARFSKNQVGLLDFSYRIKALKKKFKLTIVINIPVNHIELQVAGAEYIFLPESEGRFGWLRYCWDSARLIRKRKPNVAILLNSSVAPVSIMTRGVPTSLYWNEHPTHFTGLLEGVNHIKCAAKAALRWLLYHGARKSTLVMPIGEALYEDLLAHGCDLAKLRLIYMGVDSIFNEVGIVDAHEKDDHPLELIYIGSVTKERGRDVMLEALAMANMEGEIARLTIIGACADQQKYCAKHARQFGIADSVVVHGRVPGQAIPFFLKNADAGLCLWENQPWWRFNPPTKLFEYLVAGLPVIASNIRTHTRYIRHGYNGLIFEYDSVNLTQAIQMMWERRKELPALKKRAFESSTPYLWGNIEPVFLESIERIAGK